ncbi:MAG: hypothetical protein ACKER6_00015 [Candidatus Hodgkinia cicadicola]
MILGTTPDPSTTEEVCEIKREQRAQRSECVLNANLADRSSTTSAEQAEHHGAGKPYVCVRTNIRRWDRCRSSLDKRAHQRREI